MIIRSIIIPLLFIFFFPLLTQAQPIALDSLISEIEDAMGGRAAYQNTRYLEWTFFGRRHLLWDKWSGDVRIDFTDNDNVFVINVNDGTGKIWLDGHLQIHRDTSEKYLKQAKSIWINDSYWLVMPWKLRDPGVNLRLLDPEPDTDRQRLELTFESVGDTPDNKYIIFVDPTTRRVNEWQFFTHYSDTSPRFSTPWADYEKYGAIWLSGNRGSNKLSNIAAPKIVPAEQFSTFDK